MLPRASNSTACTTNSTCADNTVENIFTTYNLGSPDNVSEQLLPWVLQHACFAIKRYLVRSDGLTNCQRWGIKYNGAICNFGEGVLADIKHSTVNKLASRNNEQKVEDIWLGETVFENIQIPQVDTTMNKDYTEDT
eukprot:6458453-Amphidinium_carterae.1